MRKKRWRIYVFKLKKKILFICALIIVLIILILLKNSKVLNIFNYRGDGIIVVDPGHGGIDGGTSDRKGLLEKDINLEISLKLKKELKKEGFKVIMTRETDESLERHSDINASRYKRDLNGRKRIINENNPIAFVSVHVNSSKKSSARGVKIYHFPTSIEGENLAKYIGHYVDKIVYDDYLKDTSISSEIIGENYYILRETNTTGVLIEVGFITNEMDKKLIVDEGYQKQIASAISKGIRAYLEEVKDN